MADGSADPAKVRRLAQTLGFQIGPLEKAVRLASFLARLADHPYLGSRFVLKGGTALNLYHADLPRLSADADLNYVGAVERTQMEAERAHVFGHIEALAGELGYACAVEQDGYALRKYRLPYAGANGNLDHIMLDLNLLERVPVLVPADRLEPPTALEVPGPPVPCLRLDELAGSKLATLLIRGACRDLFDVAHLATRTDVDWRVATKVALFHGALDHVEMRNMDLRRVTGLRRADFDRDVRNLLRKGGQVTIERLQQQAVPIAERAIRLDPTEETFRQELARGHWDPALLFGDMAINPDLVRHPGMAWRLRNPRARFPR